MDVQCDADSQAFENRINISDSNVFDQFCTTTSSSPETLTIQELTDDVTQENQSLVYYLDNGSQEQQEFTIDENSQENEVHNIGGNAQIPVAIILCQNEDEVTVAAHYVIQQQHIAVQEQNDSEIGPTANEQNLLQNHETIKITDQELYIVSGTGTTHVQPIEEEDHKEEEASAKKEYSCKVPGCDRTFKWAANLHYHMLKHSGAKPHKCTHKNCDKAFLTDQRLQVHMLTHTGEKPFRCTHGDCSKAFSTAGNLKNHSRTHTGEKPFLCEVAKCGKRFAELSSLKKHANTHTGEKKFPCPECGRCFAQAGSRNVHMQRHRRDVKATWTEIDVNLPVTSSEADVT